MRVAPRLLAAVLAVSIPLASAAVDLAPAAAQDPRGAFTVADTPLPPAGPGDPVVGLTFDDGPHPEFTPKVLEILRRYNVRATFFFLGVQAERHPELVLQVQAEGHAIANHTFSHPRLPGLSDEAFSAQVDRTQDLLERITGQRPSCLRPPYGASDPVTVERLQARNLTPVLWTQDSRDFERVGADAIVANALKHVGPGSIVLLHDAGGNRNQTIEALPRIIEGIAAEGLGFVPLCQPDVHIPKGVVEAVEGGKGKLRVTGWVHDPDVPEPIEATVLVDGVEVATVPAAVDRPELAERGLATAHGFDVTVNAPAGTREVCVRGMNVGPGSVSPSIGCMAAEVLDPLPFSIPETVNRTRLIRSYIQLRLADPPQRIREAWAAYWTVLLTGPRPS